MDNEGIIRGLLDAEDRDQAIEFQTINLEDQLVVHVVAEGRCLYYIWLIVAADQLKNIQALITQGQEERVSRELGRFELLIMTEDPDTFELDFVRARKESEGIDERTRVRLESPGA
jgi:hypothetical protein